MSKEYYDVRYQLYEENYLVTEILFRYSYAKKDAYELGLGLANAMGLTPCQKEHDIDEVGAEYQWITSTPSDAEEVILVTPSKNKPERIQQTVDKEIDQ